MKRKLLISGIFSVMLIFAMALFTGCDAGVSDSGSDPGGITLVDYAISFETGEGGGTPPETQYFRMSSGSSRSVILPGKGGMTAPSGKIFKGWELNGNIYAEGYGYPYQVEGDLTFIAQWAEPGDDPGNTRQEGVYIGIISFAGDAADVTGGVPLLLDAAGKINLTSKLSSDYTISNQSGTALFYAVHRAFANLKSRESQYPANLESVNVITFTDGLDNGSTGKSAQSPIEGQTFDSDDDYTAYLSQQISNRTIAGKPITAYSVGVRGSDVTNTTKFDDDLAKIASAGKSQTLTNFGNLQETFTSIANSLQMSRNTTFTMKTTLLAPNTKVRMTFDVTGTSATDAAASSKYIEGVIGRTGTGTDMVYTFSNITYAGGLGSDQGAGPITGVINGPEVNFEFTGVEGYDPSTDEEKAKQWLMSSGSTAWQVNSEYDVGGATSTKIESSSIIYLVLDSSTSLTTAQIGQIRSAVQGFVDSLYDQLNASGGGGNTSGATSSNAIVLTLDTYGWPEGSISSSFPAVWYRVSVGYNEKRYVSARDRNYSSSYTSDIAFEVYDSALHWQATLNAGDGDIEYYRVPSSETYGTSKRFYIKVVPYNGSIGNYGTYAIHFD